jgi:hypothetical protein
MSTGISLLGIKQLEREAYNSLKTHENDWRFIFVGCILLLQITKIYIILPSIATEMIFIYYNLIHHNMFRPLRALFRWNIHQSFLYGAINTKTDPLFL